MSRIGLTQSQTGLIQFHGEGVLGTLSIFPTRLQDKVEVVVIQGHTKEELLRQSYKVVAVLRQTRDSVVSGVVERVCFMMCRAAFRQSE